MDVYINSYSYKYYMYVFFFTKRSSGMEESGCCFITDAVLKVCSLTFIVGNYSHRGKEVPNRLLVTAGKAGFCSTTQTQGSLLPMDGMVLLSLQLTC